MRDAYERFLSSGYINKEQLFDFGIQEIIYAPFEIAAKKWNELKLTIHSNQSVFIRGFGRNSSSSHMYLDFYKKILNNINIQIDQTNNHNPTKLIRDMTGYSKVNSTKYELISNYQVSHIFGRTKNVYCFTAPWNIVYIPKIMDPLTGHEAKGKLVQEFQNIFQKKSYQIFEPLINDFNQIVQNNKLWDIINEYFYFIKSENIYQNTEIDKFYKSVKEEFSPIIII